MISFYSRRHDVHKYEHDQMHIWLCSFQTLGLVMVKDVAALDRILEHSLAGCVTFIFSRLTGMQEG